MPLKDIYTISGLHMADGQFEARISFDPGHDVFSGHFPGQPVVPGVVLIRMVREVVSLVTGKTITLQRAVNVKFLNMIVPAIDQKFILSGSIQQDEAGIILVNAGISGGETAFFRFRGDFA